MSRAVQLTEWKQVSSLSVDVAVYACDIMVIMTQKYRLHRQAEDGKGNYGEHLVRW